MDNAFNDNMKPLDRYMSPLDVWGMAFGCMVGWGVFAMLWNTFLPVAGPAGEIISLLIGMVIMLVIGAVTMVPSGICLLLEDSGQELAY